jgi:hypothetical protein
MMEDVTEGIRRAEVARINGEIESDNKDDERKRLEALYGEVLDKVQMMERFEVLGFMAPYVVVKRKTDWKRGKMEFQHHPRFYFNFVED